MSGEQELCEIKMRSPTRIIVCLVLLETSIELAFGQVSRERVMGSLDHDGKHALIQEINAMPAEARRVSVLQIVGLIEEELKSGREYNEGKSLIAVLPAVADDATLAASLRPYLDYGDARVRKSALEAMSQGRGSAVGKMLTARIEMFFRQLPMPPFRPADENEDAVSKANDPGIAFFYCLEGLLKSESEQMRETGRKYVALVRTRYSASEEGRRVIEEIEQELKRHGVSLSEGSGGRPAALETGQQALLTTRAPTASPASSPLPTPTAIESASATAEPEAAVWPWMIGGILALTVVALLVWKRRG